jgi:superfamily II DNA/RNA helicase
MDIESMLDAIRREYLSQFQKRIFYHFEELGLKPQLEQGIPYDLPTPAQLITIPTIISSPLDIIVEPRKNAGNTTALCISMLQLVDTKSRVLFVASSVEAAQNVRELIPKLRYHMDLSDEFDHQILVGTLEELNLQYRQHLKKVKNVFIDDGDQFTDVKPVQELLKRTLEQTRITAVTSANSPLAQLLYKPTKIQVPERNERKCENVEYLIDMQHFYVRVDDDEARTNLLEENYENFSVTKCIVYCSSRKRVEWVTKFMAEKNLTVISLPSDTQLSEKEQLLSEYSSGIIVTTDVFSTELNFNDVSIVVNLDLPKESDNYARRANSGEEERSEPGTVISFVSEHELAALISHGNTLEFSAREILPGFGVSSE